MATRIRLKRLGKKKKAVYRIVVSESRVSRDGGSLDDVGFYDPLKDPIEVRLDVDKVKQWLSKGALPTPIVTRLLAGEGIVPKSKIVSANQGVSKKELNQKKNKSE